ncbi:MAG: flagellar export chaperone FliS [Acidobacteriia bacterium]|nr:flagellar export chaperone FliS [Terriglobia bacterium]
MTSDPTLTYRQVSASGATPIGQVLSLYDTILRDFLRAISAIQAGDVETRVFELNHALLVIAHLQNVLDFERGGEAAKHFELFYTVARGMIVQANIAATPKAIEELIDLFGGIRQAWYLANEQLAADPQRPRIPDLPPDAREKPAASAEFDELETSRLQWSV